MQYIYNDWFWRVSRTVVRTGIHGGRVSGLEMSTLVVSTIDAHAEADSGGHCRRRTRVWPPSNNAECSRDVVASGPDGSDGRLHCIVARARIK